MSVEEPTEAERWEDVRYIQWDLIKRYFDCTLDQDLPQFLNEFLLSEANRITEEYRKTRTGKGFVQQREIAMAGWMMELKGEADIVGTLAKRFGVHPDTVKNARKLIPRNKPLAFLQRRKLRIVE